MEEKVKELIEKYELINNPIKKWFIIKDLKSLLPVEEKNEEWIKLEVVVAIAFADTSL